MTRRMLWPWPFVTLILIYDWCCLCFIPISRFHELHLLPRKQPRSVRAAVHPVRSKCQGGSKVQAPGSRNSDCADSAFGSGPGEVPRGAVRDELSGSSGDV